MFNRSPVVSGEKTSSKDQPTNQCTWSNNGRIANFLPDLFVLEIINLNTARVVRIRIVDNAKNTRGVLLGALSPCLVSPTNQGAFARLCEILLSPGLS